MHFAVYSVDGRKTSCGPRGGGGGRCPPWPWPWHWHAGTAVVRGDGGRSSQVQGRDMTLVITARQNNPDCFLAPRPSAQHTASSWNPSYVAPASPLALPPAPYPSPAHRTPPVSVARREPRPEHDHGRLQPDRSATANSFSYRPLLDSARTLFLPSVCLLVCVILSLSHIHTYTHTKRSSTDRINHRPIASHLST